MRLVVAAIALVAAADVRADVVPIGTWRSYEAGVLHDTAGRDGAPAQITYVGARGDLFVGARPTLHAAAEIAVGATIGEGGFYYQLGLLPVGVGRELMAFGWVGVATGIVLTGAHDTLDDAVALPLDLAAVVPFGERARVLAGVRATVLARADSRQSGSSIPGVDELEAKLAFGFGADVSPAGWTVHQGWFGGVAYREMLDGHFVGVVVGFTGETGVP